MSLHVQYSEISEEEKVRWRDWNPGLDNGNLTLGEVMATQKGNAANEVHWLVRLFENPNPPIKIPGLFPLPGAIKLERHDAMHALLGRGMLPQDEAFVIGFTMGASKACSKWQFKLFEIASSRFYPSPWNFTQEHLISLRLGFNAGWEIKATDLGNFPFEYFKKMTLDELRGYLGISRQKLYAVYRKEKLLLPGTVESKRLDSDWMGIDPSYIVRGAK